MTEQNQPTEIAVHYFAAARELAGVEQETLRLPKVALTGHELLAWLGQLHPRLAPFLPRMRLALNDELVQLDVRVQAGDRAAVLPPVAGGAGDPPDAVAGGSGDPPDAVAGGSGDPPDDLVHCAISDAALSVDDAIRRVTHPSAGGIAVFLGVVRDHAAGKPVARLDYEAHAALAEKQLAQIARAVVAAHPGTRLCAVHRVGSLRVGDLAVIVAASSAHRDAAFAACREAIERIKAEVAIWKKEWDPEGAAHWVNFG